MLGVALSAIMKVCVSVFVGIFTGKSIPFARTTLRDFGFLSSNVLLPCLALSSTAESISWEIVLRCVILLLFMLIQLAVGYGCAVLMTWVLFPTKPHHTGLNATLAKDIRLELMYEKITVPRNTTAISSNNIVNNNTNKDNKNSNEIVEEQEKHNEVDHNTNTNVATDRNNSNTVENGITMINTSSSSNTTTINKPFIAVIVKDKVCHVDMITERELLPLLEIPSIQYDHYPAYLWMSIIACTIPNTISVPLALLQNLITSLSFLNFNYGVTYIMLFNTVCTIYLWGAAPFLLRSAQRQVQERSQLRELMMELKFLHSKMDAYTQTDNSALLINSSRSSSNKMSPLEAPLTPTTQLSHSDTSESNKIHNSINNNNTWISECGERSYAWEELNLIRIFRESEYKEIQSGVRSVLDQTTHTPNEQQVSVPRRKTRRLRPYKHYKWLTNRLMWRRIAKQALYLPFLATLVGAIIGLIPFLKNLFFNGGVLEMIMDAMALVAQGAIPALLVLIGANLGGSLTSTPAVIASSSSCYSLLASNGRTSVMRGGRRGMLNKMGEHNNNNSTALSSLRTQPSESTLLATVVMENYGQNVNFTFDAADLELLASEGDLNLNAAAAAFDRRAAEEAAQQKAEMAERKRISKLKRAAKRREARLAAAAANAKVQHEGDNTITRADKSDANKPTSKDFAKNRIKQNNEFDTEVEDYDEDYDEDEEDDDEEMEMSVDMHASFALHPIVELTGVHDMVNKTSVSEEGHEMQTWQERAEQVESKISHGILCKTQDESNNNDRIKSKNKSNQKREDETHKQNGASLHKEDKLHHKSHGKTLMTNTQYVMFTSPSPAQSPTTTRADMAAHTREENEENVSNENTSHVIIDTNINKNENEKKEDDSNHVVNSHRERNESTLEHPTAAPQSTSVEIILPEENEQPNTYWAAVCAAFSLNNVSKRFVWGNIFVRLVLVPAINLIILYAAVKLFPSMFIHGKEYGRTLVVTLILQLSAPTAISSLVLFQAQEFMVYTWAKMLFFQYALCILSILFWLSIGLQILDLMQERNHLGN